MSSNKKTRTTSAHGPIKAKNNFKATTNFNPRKPSATSTSTAGKPFKPTSTTATTDSPRGKKRPATEDEPAAVPTTATLLSATEEIDFPRGGGTGLTQSEVKEARLEGELEFNADEEELERKLNLDVPEKSKAKRRKLEREKLAGELKKKNSLPTDAFRIENLNYKRLVPGLKVLAQVVLVTTLELIVSLPNQLLAHIPITNVSSEFTSLLEAEAEESSNDSEDDEEEEGGAPPLSTLFSKGDWVSAIVVDSSDDNNEDKRRRSGKDRESNNELIRGSRKVTLSLEPEKVNKGIPKGDLKPGFVLTASIKSQEDHGYLLNLGFSSSFSAFLPFKEALKYSDKPLFVGEILRVRIKNVGENQRTCEVSCGKVEVGNTTLTSATSITSLLPGHLLSGLITSILPTGLNLKLLGYYSGTISSLHLPLSTPTDSFKIGQKIKCRILWGGSSTGVGGDEDSGKKFALSAEEGVLGFAGEERGWGGLKVGEVLEVEVKEVDEEWGLECEVEKGEWKGRGFVHISHITDSRLASIPKSGPWKIGSKHQARVIGFSQVDRLVQLSFQETVLAKSFWNVEDLAVGQVIKGTVKRLSDTALFVDLGGNYDGVVWPNHYSDIRLKNPEKKFKAGTKVTGRVYSIDSEKNRIVLTLKKQLVQSELPIVTKTQEAKIGLITEGAVSKVLEKGILVDFFGGVRAIVPAGEAAQGFTSSDDLVSLFPIGKVLSVRIIAVDPTTSRIAASIRRALLPVAAAPTSLPEIGTITSGTVTALHETNLVLELDGDADGENVKALMSFATLARFRKVTVENLKETLETGVELKDLVVVSKNLEKGFVVVGLVPTRSTLTAQTSTKDVEEVTIDSLTVGQKLSGVKFFGKLPPKVGGVLISLSNSSNLRGRVGLTELSDDFDLVEGVVGTSKGTQVDCVVLSVDKELNRVELSLRGSRLGEEVEVKDKVVKTVQELVVGKSVRGFVKNVAKNGLFVTLGGDVTARVQIKELFDEFVKEWQPRFTVGQLLEGKVIAVNKSSNQVELSLRKNATVKKNVVEIGDLVKGRIVRGVVRRVEAYGAFIRIDDSSISGLCHKSKVTDKENTAWTEFVHEGDKVKAIITEINEETKKVSLGLKASLFPEGELSDQEQESDEDEEDDEDEDEESGEEDAIEGVEEADDSASEIDIEIPVASTSKLAAVPATEPLKVSSGFKWDGGDDRDDDAEVPEEEEDSEDEEEEEGATTEPITKKRRSAVEDRTGDLDSQTPTSVGDFERLLLGSPNSSYIWIQFIAFYAGLSQVDKAREIGRRALKTINFREEQEKLNVWVALLNLENSYGTEASLEELFKEAVQSNDAKTAYLRLVDIYERAGKFEAEEELFQRIVKKFGQSSKVWTLFGQFYLTRGRPDDARDLLPRSLKSLEKRKHVKTISKFAQLEFKLGDAERGRTIFEGIMDSYPKRLDLWFVYLDMEIKQKNVTGVRALFDRVLAQRLSSKKGKSVFKKWLAFERESGDEAGVETCKSKALAFVESLA